MSQDYIFQPGDQVSWSGQGGQRGHGPAELAEVAEVRVNRDDEYDAYPVAVDFKHMAKTLTFTPTGHFLHQYVGVYPPDLKLVKAAPTQE